MGISIKSEFYFEFNALEKAFIETIEAFQTAWLRYPTDFLNSDGGYIPAGTICEDEWYKAYSAFEGLIAESFFEMIWHGWQEKL